MGGTGGRALNLPCKKHRDEPQLSRSPPRTLTCPDLTGWNSLPPKKVGGRFLRWDGSPNKKTQGPPPTGATCMFCVQRSFPFYGFCFLPRLKVGAGSVCPKAIAAVRRWRTPRCSFCFLRVAAASWRKDAPPWSLGRSEP